MQKLIFEPAWNKTISQKDRKSIEEIFQRAEIVQTTNVSFTPLWQAINHKGDLLVTVLIHNVNNQKLPFDHTKLKYFEDEALIAEHVFSFPSILLSPNVSMPWTFIFPKENLFQQPSFQNGYLQIVDETF
ncbi:SLAP domain-containing protein [Niallia sp. 03133]|uniref:SLAP domain-containing protein n=1 Tax=Niallia sp. 03133 TaxID=3458060 RepID=UPI004044F0BF